MKARGLRFAFGGIQKDPKQYPCRNTSYRKASPDRCQLRQTVLEHVIPRSERRACQFGRLALPVSLAQLQLQLPLFQLPPLASQVARASPLQVWE